MVFFGLPNQAYWVSEHQVSARTSDEYSSLVDRMIKHQRPLWSVLLVLIPEV